MLSYKPKSFSDLLINDPHSAADLKGILDGRPPFPAFGINGILLHGVAGTGKTALMHVLPDWMEKSGKLPKSPMTGLFSGARSEYVNIIECGVAVNSVEQLRKIQKDRERDLAHSASGWRWVCFDEVDVLPRATITSLKSIMSNSQTTVFIFTTNNPQKLEKEFRNRCVQIEMNQMPNLIAYVPLGRQLLVDGGFAADHLTEAKIVELAADAVGSLRTFSTSVMREAHR